LPRSHLLADSTSIATGELTDEVIVLFPRPLNPAVWDRFVEHLSPVGNARLDHLLVVHDLVADGPCGLFRVVAACQGLAPTGFTLADGGHQAAGPCADVAAGPDLARTGPARAEAAH
jgi:hypothetical protein